MTNKKNKSCKSFFESVAHHNLERFHSETIAWIFKTFPNSAKNFIKSIHTDISSIDKIELNNEYCWAELNQIDILLKYSYNSKNYQIIIENKMKASEHKIEAKKLKKGKSFDEYSMQSNEHKIETEKLLQIGKLSQTEYYYFREKMERKENNNYEYCRYVYLKPSRVDHKDFTKKLKNDLNSVNYYFKKLNTWNKKLGDNPWKTITYEELIETIKNNDAVNDKQQLNENIIIANAYINFIEDNIKEEVYLDDFNKNKEYARFDYFKLLFALVKTKFKDVSILNSFSDDNRQNSIYEYIEAGSSNGGMPLFAFYKKIPLTDTFNFFKPKQEFINIGIQVQGENFKYYVSADDYDNTVIIPNKTPNNYGEFVKEILKRVTEDSLITDYVKVKVDFSKYKNDGFNANTTKSFYSRSYKIKDFVDTNNPRDIFKIADEISEKVNHFVNFDITNAIETY
jgi:hypothetical protein